MENMEIIKIWRNLLGKFKMYHKLQDALEAQINMKSLSNIILVSSESKRQLIQRLGRVLRVDDENNPNKKAFVLDFIETKQYDNQDKDGADFRRFEFLEQLSKC